ncbi:MAG: putative sulfate exporter family transporter, partial [Ignavibacteriaceae bacterium]
MNLEKKSVVSEDWLSLWIGLFVFILSLGLFIGFDILGWGIKTSVWTDITNSLSSVSTNFSGLPGIVSLLLTYLFMLIIVGIGLKAMGVNFSELILPFTIIFFISYLCWLLGHFAYIAATSDQLGKFDISWSLNLTGEAGYIIALIVGLIIGNFFPRLVNKIKAATRPELFIKTAIVIMGAGLGVKAAESLGLASIVMFQGLSAIIVAYLIYWALVYFIARKYFRFSKEWAAPLASGISICGVSAAIATGSAIRSRPIIPIMVSSLVVVFAVFELILLPFFAQIFLWKEPMVAAAWMGLAVKTDGAAVASGAITDALIRAKVLSEIGVNYKEGWMVMTTTTVKVFIDVFIGIWAFVLALIWCSKIEKNPTGEKVRAREIWDRFPKFVIGYVLTFLIFLFV